MKNKKTSKNYQKIITQLESLYAHALDMARGDDTDDIWKEDMEALQEAIDIIYDYEKATEQATELIQKYEVAEPIIRREMGIYVCPLCGKRTEENHSHCHWCGKKLQWDKFSRTENKRARKRDEQNG